jgi:hypothetical protein
MFEFIIGSFVHGAKSRADLDLVELGSERWRTLGEAEGDQEAAACRARSGRLRVRLPFCSAESPLTDPLDEPADRPATGVVAEQQATEEEKERDEREQNLGHCSESIGEF